MRRTLCRAAGALNSRRKWLRPLLSVRCRTLFLLPETFGSTALMSMVGFRPSLRTLRSVKATLPLLPLKPVLSSVLQIQIHLFSSSGSLSFSCDELSFECKGCVFLFVGWWLFVSEASAHPVQYFKFISFPHLGHSFLCFGVKELSCECKGCVFILADWCLFVC